MTLPNFLLIGAGRCGTTSLYEYLRQHPDVFMSPVKEPRYFDNIEPRPRRPGPRSRQRPVTDRAEYERLFAAAGDATAIGEASPTYIRDVAAPRHAAALIPNARVVAILRDPVERAYSSYLGMKHSGIRSPGTFEAALAEEARRGDPGPLTGYVTYSRYHEQLQRWYAHFPREQVRVFLYDDLRDDPFGLLAGLFGFLGVDPSFRPDVSRQYGRTGRVANPVLRSLWERGAPLLPTWLHRRVRPRVTSHVVRPPMREDTRARLRETFRPDVLELQALIGRDLSHWL